ncbi:MAG TPA: hypothetical protein VLL76_08765 [Candidatus Omnitrophota bacterium]|nr:hypothetical protein [Candidatus Omnitrophota bacterium]
MPILRPAFGALAIMLVTATAQAQAPQAPAAPAPEAPQVERLPAEEPAPGFQPIRPAGEEPAPAPVPPVQSQPQPEPAPAVMPAPAAPPAEEPVVPTPAQPQLPAWSVAVLILAGAFLASLFGVLASTMARRGEINARRRAVAATLATEMETRRQAFEAVPLPPNVEAGVFFVSAITSLSGIDAGFRSAQTDIHLLPDKLAAHISVHYAAVQRVADFVKGQSLAAAVRMLQANRIGGHPCPDAGTMREAHVELTAAFRGTEKLVASLRQLG